MADHVFGVNRMPLKELLVAVVGVSLWEGGGQDKADVTGRTQS